MNERIKNMKENIQKLNNAGVRRTTFYTLITASLKETLGEAVPIRRAKAFTYLLDHVEQTVAPYELLAGSIIGMWPVDGHIASYELRKQEAIKVLEEYLLKRESIGGKAAAKRSAVTFERRKLELKSRFALMARDHYDANIDFNQLQSLISEMQRHFEGKANLEKYEIGRELERYFKYDYGEEAKRLSAELPWSVSNHIDLNYQKVVNKGFGKLRDEIETSLMQAVDTKEKDFYLSAQIAIAGVIGFIDRYADTLLKAGNSQEAGAGRAVELRSMAAICRKISVEKPETFKEAMQLVWMTHLIANIGGGSALSFARFDQYMYPFYKKDMESGAITEDEAREILCCMWLKINEPQMRTVQSLSVGGVTPEGKDAANGLTRLCLEVAADMKLPYPNLSVRVNKVSPEWLYDEAVNTIKAGIGQPMILNDELWIPNLKRLGYPVEIAREYYNMGCVEVMLQGKQPSWVGGLMVAFPLAIEKVLKKWKQHECLPDTFEDFMQAYLSEVKGDIAENINDGLAYLNLLREKCYDPFASILVEGCLESGTDIFQGGAICPPHVAISGTGLGTAADSLSAIKKFVYDEKKVTLGNLYEALSCNFKGFENLQVLLDRNTPAFGNDIDDVDEIAARIYNAYCDDVFAYNDSQKKEKYVNVLFSYTSHVYMGEITGATPNGRMAGGAFSDAIGPSQGKDVGGPTKLLNSVLRLDHSKVTGGFAMNIKVNPTLVNDEAGTNAIKSLIKAYIKNGGPQIQFNFVDPDMLKEAQLFPEKHNDIVVRVAGYCEYFVNLDRTLQDEIVQRTMHEME